jgi:hypothetical protein
MDDYMIFTGKYPNCLADLRSNLKVSRLRRHLSIETSYKLLIGDLNVVK